MKIKILFVIFFIMFPCICLMSACDKNNSDNKTQTTQECLHNYESEIIFPSCIQQGYTIHKCNKCGKSYNDSFTNPVGHNYVEREQNYKCLKCNHYEDDGFTFEYITTHMANNNDSYKGRENTYYVKTVSKSALENGKITIPRKHLGCQVTGIYKGALYNVRDTMTELIITSSIKYIGSSLISYDGQFFTPNKTITLKKIEFNSDCSNINISHTAFQFCKNVTNIIMPTNCISLINHDDLIGNHFLFEDTAFYKINRIEKDGLYYLFNILLESDKNKIGSSVSVEDGTTIISNQVFIGNTNITLISIPLSVKYIGEKAFAQCVNLRTMIYNGTIIRYNLIKIEANAFQDCKNITYQYIN